MQEFPTSAGLGSEPCQKRRGFQHVCVSVPTDFCETLLMFLGDTCAVTDPVTGETRAFTHNVGEVTPK